MQFKKQTNGKLYISFIKKFCRVETTSASSSTIPTTTTTYHHQHKYFIRPHTITNSIKNHKCFQFLLQFARFFAPPLVTTWAAHTLLTLLWTYDNFQPRQCKRVRNFMHNVSTTLVTPSRHFKRHQSACDHYSTPAISCPSTSRLIHLWVSAQLLRSPTTCIDKL